MLGGILCIVILAIPCLANMVSAPPPLNLRAKIFFGSIVKGHRKMILEVKGGFFLKGGLGMIRGDFLLSLYLIRSSCTYSFNFSTRCKYFKKDRHI